MTTLPEVTKAVCNDCPWRRTSAAGWLGPHDADEWLAMAHGEVPIACHLTIQKEGGWEGKGLRQCAGAARYRANVVKRPRDHEIAVGPKDESIFGSPREFNDHHRRVS